MSKSGKIAQLIALILVLICICPYVYVFVTSLMGPEGEWTLQYYYQTFLGSTQFLTRFWKSLFLCLCIAAGQMIASTLAGFGFAKYQTLVFLNHNHLLQTKFFLPIFLLCQFH